MKTGPAVTKKLERVASALEGAYGRPELDASDPLDELIATILSQNTTSTNCERAYDAMRKMFPTWDNVMAARRSALERALRPAGLAKIRSARIQRILRTIARERGTPNLDHLRDLPTDAARQDLLQFDGVGPKTADCVLLFALRRDVFPIDTHIHRILTRLGIIPEGMSVEKAHGHVLPSIPKGRHLDLHLNLIRHGRRVCRPSNPACDRCVLRRECRYPGARSCA